MESYKGSGEALETISLVLGNEIRAAAVANHPSEGKEVHASPTICTLCDTDLAIYYCQTCSCNLCHICSQGHRRQTNTRHHELVSIENTFNAVYCLHHPDKGITHYCATCKTISCNECDNNKHKKHTFNTIDKFKQELKDLCQDLAKQLRTPYDVITEKEENLGTFADDYIKQCQNAKKELSTRKSKLSKLIGKIFDENNDSVSKEETELRKKCVDINRSVTTFKSKFERTVHSVGTVVLSADLNMIVHCIQSMQVQADEACQLQNELDLLSKSSPMQISAENDWFDITTDVTNQYFGVINLSEFKPLEQCDVLEKYMRPVIQKFSEENSILKKEVSSLESEQQKIIKEKQKLTDETFTLKNKVSALESEQQKIAKEKQKVTDDNSILKKKVLFLESDLQNMIKEKQKLTDETSTLKNKVSALESEQQKIAKEKQKLTDETSTLKNKVSVLESEQQKIAKEKQKLTDDNSILKKKVLSLESEQHNMIKEEQILDKRKTLKDSLAYLLEKVRVILSTMDVITKEIHKMQQVEKSYENQGFPDMDRLKELKATYAKYEEEVRDNEVRYRGILKEFTEIASESSSLSVEDCIEELIKEEQNQHRIGWQQRVQELIKLKQQVEVIKKTKQNKGLPVNT